MGTEREPPPWLVGIRRCSVQTAALQVIGASNVQCHLLLSQRNGWTGNSDLCFVRSFVRTLEVRGGGAV